MSSCATDGALSHDRLSGVPPLPRTYVARTELDEQLDRATQNAVTLLVAPAGAGKTLGVSGWLRGGTAPPTALAHRLGAGATWVHADATLDGPAVEALLERSLGRGTDPGLVVVDDAHELPPSALRVIEARLGTAPRSMRVLLLSRWDLPLRRLVPELLGDLTVIRGDALRMTADEARALVAAHARTDIPEVVEIITRHAGGWCAALVLVSRAVGASPDRVAAAHRCAQGDAGVADRVADEVFSALGPKERHLLLCTAGEPVVTTSAAIHLTHDPQAGEVLAGLEMTGLLVTRVTGSDVEGELRFRIHPLLAEVVRRRQAAGGPDVARARSAVSRAVELDLGRGDSSRSFDRLVTVHEHDRAAQVLAHEGLRLLMRGQGPRVAAFARLHPDVVARHPEAWFSVAMERWTVGDTDAATHWMDRIERAATVEAEAATLEAPPAGRTSPAVRACIGLMRARLGLEPLQDAARRGQVLVAAHLESSHDDGDPAGMLPVLMVELGAAQSWLGHLDDAETCLSTAVSIARFRGLPALAATAASHLAMTEYMAGREETCSRLAAEAAATVQDLPWRVPFVQDRSHLALLLSGLVDPSRWTGPATEAGPDVHPADLVSRFWVRLLDARLQLRAGSVAGAGRVLAVPTALPVPGPLPVHLQAAQLVERAFLGALACDHPALCDIAQQLRRLELPGEAALVTGLAADLAGDRGAAAEAFLEAASTGTFAQPASRPLALACSAQVLDAMGQHTEALERLRAAAALTETRRNVVPFLGWCRQGTPMATLLSRLDPRDPGLPLDWTDELARTASGRPDIAAHFSPRTATAVERSRSTPCLAPPHLSPREREVLNELARGATYADIAAHLYVSENTVKTHVSSLYAKLAASRRSDALTTARSMNLC